MNDSTSTRQCVHPDLVKQALDKIRTVADCIRTAGEIPSGTLYSLFLNVLSWEEYQRIIATLKNAGIISESNYLLKWELEAAERRYMDPIKPASPIPYMGRDQARKRLEYHRDKQRQEAEKKKQEKHLTD